MKESEPEPKVSNREPPRLDLDASYRIIQTARMCGNRGLLVLPSKLKMEVLHQEAVDVIYDMIRENRVIGLDFLKSPGSVNSR